jgi:hypothetical protein
MNSQASLPHRLFDKVGQLGKISGLASLLLVVQLSLSPPAVALDPDAPPTASERARANEVVACASLLADLGRGLKQSPEELTALVGPRPDCEGIRLDPQRVSGWSDGLESPIQEAWKHPDWWFSGQTLWHRSGAGARPVVSFPAAVQVLQIAFDPQGRPWWLAWESGGQENQFRISRLIGNRPVLFAQMSEAIDELRVGPQGDVWAIDQDHEFNHEAWTSQKLQLALHFDSRGQLIERLEHAPAEPPDPPEASFVAKPLVRYLEDIGSTSLPGFGLQPPFGEGRLHYQALFLSATGSAIPIPASLEWLEDRPQHRAWLLWPNIQRFSESDESPAFQPYPSAEGSLFLLSSQGHTQDFAVLGDVSLLRLDDQGHPWLLQGTGQTARGLQLVVDAKSRFQAHYSPYPLLTGKEDIGARAFDPQSGYELERLARLGKVSPQSQTIRMSRPIGREYAEPVVRMELRVLPEQKLITDSYHSNQSDWHDISQDLYYRPDLNLLIEYGSDTYTHPYSPGSRDWLYVWRPDRPQWLSSSTVRLYRILNP